MSLSYFRNYQEYFLYNQGVDLLGLPAKKQVYIIQKKKSNKLEPRLLGLT
jgi:hypothetical protein